MPNLFIELTTEGNFREKVEAILEGGKGHGVPLIVHNALRTEAQQAKNVASGVSQTMRSKHLPGTDGLARGADIVDSRYLWSAPQYVWVLIGRLALTQGCNWGGLWGLPGDTRAMFKEFLTDRSKPFDEHAWLTATGKPGPIGWDAAHVESATCCWNKLVQKWTG